MNLELYLKKKQEINLCASNRLFETVFFISQKSAEKRRELRAEVNIRYVGAFARLRLTYNMESAA